MGLIVDPQATDTNSYVSLVEATLILGENPYADAWDALSFVPSATGWVADGAQVAGTSVVNIKNGTGTFEVGSVIKFAGHDTMYSVVSETPTSVNIAPNLVSDIADEAVIRRLTYSAKEKMLLHATKTLDAQVDWRGSAAELNQPLRWPRFSVRDCDGHDYCNDCFPQDLKVATAEFALHLAKRDLSSVPELLGQGFSRAKVDVLEIEVDSSQVVTMMPDYVQDLLGCMGSYSPTKSSGAKTMELLRT